MAQLLSDISFLNPELYAIRLGKLRSSRWSLNGTEKESTGRRRGLRRRVGKVQGGCPREHWVPGRMGRRARK